VRGFPSKNFHHDTVLYLDFAVTKNKRPRIRTLWVRLEFLRNPMESLDELVGCCFREVVCLIHGLESVSRTGYHFPTRSSHVSHFPVSTCGIGGSTGGQYCHNWATHEEASDTSCHCGSTQLPLSSWSRGGGGGGSAIRSACFAALLAFSGFGVALFVSGLAAFWRRGR
jgi:hypothetical protein